MAFLRVQASDRQHERSVAGERPPQSGIGTSAKRGRVDRVVDDVHLPPRPMQQSLQASSVVLGHRKDPVDARRDDALLQQHGPRDGHVHVELDRDQHRGEARREGGEQRVFAPQRPGQVRVEDIRATVSQCPGEPRNAEHAPQSVGHRRDAPGAGAKLASPRHERFHAGRRVVRERGLPVAGKAIQ